VPRAVAFSPDGRRLAVCAGGTVRVWDLATRQLVADLASPEVMALAFDRAGRRLVAGGTAETAQVWDTATWQVERALPHGAKVYGAAFTADGTRLLTACSDNTVRVWDLATYQEVAQLRGHGAYVYQLAFSPDGTRLATASGDFTVRVWDTLSAQERVAPVP
jgi:WD40 repeat protein